MVVTDSILTQVHREATKATVQELATFLQEVLSRRLTALIAGVGNGRTVRRWVSAEVTEIRDYQTERRLRTAYEIARLLAQFDSKETVRAWFVGLNPQLGDLSPIEAIEQGKLKEVRAAARAFVLGG